MSKPVIDKKFLKKAALRLKTLREINNLTQEEVLNDTGIHIGRLEMGERDFSMSTLKKLCDYFKITPETFFKEL